MLSTVLNIIMFEDCRNQWSMSRPLLGLILINEEVRVFCFFSFKNLVCYHSAKGAGRSSEVERSLMVRWVVGSILPFQPVLHNWCNKGCGMCYPVCGMVHIKEPLVLIDKSSLCGGIRFPFSLSEWSLTICLTPYNRR